MNLDPIVARIKAQITGFKSVGTSADMDAALEGSVVPIPSAFVVPFSESGSRLELVGIAAQSITVRFGVILVVSNRRDATGGAALGDLTPLRQALRTAMVGWEPVAGQGELVRFAAGSLLRMDSASRLWWADQFEYTEHYRSL